MANKISRRDFLRKSGIGLAAMTVVPNVVLGKSHGHTAPSDKLNIAGVGVGGRGAGVLKSLESQNIVALCDTDWKYAKIPSIAIRELAVSGIIAQCSIRWATRSML